MRGFRTNRAIQNSKSSLFGRQSHLKLIEGGYAGQSGEQKHQVPLPDWMKVPKSLLEAQKTPERHYAVKAAVKPAAKPRRAPLKLVASNEKPATRAKTTAKAKSATTVKKKTVRKAA